MKYTFLLLLLFVIATASCDKSLMDRKVETTDEINLRGLFDTLHLVLDDHNPLLIKRAAVENLTDTSQLRLDSLGWSKELENFRDMNVRPGRLVGRYKKSESQTEGSNQIIYRSNSPKQEDLDSIVINLTGDKKLSQLRFYINYKNYLNTTQKMLLMDFHQQDEQSLPTSYHITGWQKLKTKDTVTFDILTQLKY